MATSYMTVKSVPGGMAQRLDLFFAGLGLGVNPYMLRQSRMREIQALNACTDRQLAQLGLTRDDIPRYVFRDLFD